MEEGRDYEDPKALNSATSPEEPDIWLSGMQHAQGPSTVWKSTKSKVLAVNRKWFQWPVP